MKGWIKQIAVDSVLWASIYAAIFMGEPYKIYGENIVSFFGILTLVSGVLLMATRTSVALKQVESGSAKTRSKTLSAYVALTTSVETIIVVALGWYWVAAGFVIGYMAMQSYHDEVKKITDK
ncbi:MAG: hypothetical protein ACRCXB_13070 [Aeromonadaceae bacterium]